MTTYHHHERAPFLVAFLLILLTVLTGVATFTSYWATAGSVHLKIYDWGRSGANAAFNASPSWLKCVVVTMLMAFTLELLFCLLVIPSIVFRRHVHGHALNALLSFIITILLLIAVIVFASEVHNYSFNVLGIPFVNFSLGWSWGLALASTIVAIILTIVASASTFSATRATYY